MSRVPTSYPWEAVLEPGRDEELVATSRERAQAGLSEPIPDDLHPAVLEGLAAAGIESLWAHQADTLEAARRGHLSCAVAGPGVHHEDLVDQAR